MTGRHRLFGYFLLVGVLSASCNRDPGTAAPAPPAPPPPVPAPSVAAVPSTPPPPPAKVDAVDQVALKAGLDLMLPRVLSKVDAYKKIEPNERSRFFMHPDEHKNAVIEFNTKGLTSLSMSPYIEDFGDNPDCAGTPSAGIVQMTWSLENGKKNHITVDRHYNELVNVDVSKSSRLKVEVDKGNDVTWCDWFSLGFINVK